MALHAYETWSAYNHTALPIVFAAFDFKLRIFFGIGWLQREHWVIEGRLLLGCRFRWSSIRYCNFPLVLHPHPNLSLKFCFHEPAQKTFVL